MKYAQLRSAILYHDKIKRISIQQWALWTYALVWCAEHWETDGQIPREVLREFYGDDESRHFMRTVQRLVARGLFDEKEGELYVHDWTEWNQSSIQIRSKKQHLRAVE